MPLRIFTNISSQNAQRVLDINNNMLGRAISRIASGIRIRTAADDAAGLAITEQLKADSRTLRQGTRNLNDGVALVNVAEGAMGEQSGILIRMRELASQAATGTIGQTERQTIDLEFQQLKAELDRITNTTEFAGGGILDGTLAASNPKHLILQIGATTATDDRIDLNQALDLTTVSAANLGIGNSRISTEGDALLALDQLSTAVDELIEIRARAGSVQQRLDRAFNNLNITIENLNAAVSQISDADLAEELTDLTKNQILVQSGAAMVSQSNLIPQSVLTLLS
ncbi:MAG: flagellin FliC [Candidatus Nitronauta litoralis]|uniref:Flagellin n=1 Tax=Candidatus Nitronauta litoralis TaxID=2705533 RepID=A0A7T0BWH2_9BACT|nr:MAG: flagellin FliC [Candidatus Nitronauta litoralis]